MASSSPTLLVGVDLVQSNTGPLGFARWIHESRNDHPPVRAAHVVEPFDGWGLVPAELDVDWPGVARKRLETAVEISGIPADKVELEVAMDDKAEDFLAELGERTEGGMLVIGRLAKRGEDRLVRLGSVARRLLRRLPCPVAVVPPDLTSAGVGKGPIVVAIDGTDDCIDAYQFARELGESTQRKLLLAYVVPMPEGWGVGFASPEAVQQVLRDLRIDGHRKLEAWSREQGVFGEEAVVTQGGVVSELHQIAKERDAACVVLGSRRLGPVGRWFSASTGTDLAASAECAIVVVPPPESE